MTELLERVLEHHDMIDEIPTIVLHQHELRNKLARVLGEPLTPHDGNGIRAPESCHELPLCKEAFCALILLAN